MRRSLMMLLALAVLVGGGVAFALASAQGTASAQQNDVEGEEAPADVDEGLRPRLAPGYILDDVLDDLVADGVITDDQADAITESMTERFAALREELEARRDELGLGFGRRGLGFHRHGFDLAPLLEDGVIDSDELAELGDDHPLNDPDGPAAPFLEDGQLTEEELEELRAELLPFRCRRHGSPSGGDAEDSDAAESLFSA